MKKVVDTVVEIMRATGVDRIASAFLAAFKRVDMDNLGTLRVKVRRPSPPP